MPFEWLARASPVSLGDATGATKGRFRSEVQTCCHRSCEPCKQFEPCRWRRDQAPAASELRTGRHSPRRHWPACSCLKRGAIRNFEIDSNPNLERLSPMRRIPRSRRSTTVLAQPERTSHSKSSNGLPPKSSIRFLFGCRMLPYATVWPIHLSLPRGSIRSSKGFLFRALPHKRRLQICSNRHSSWDNARQSLGYRIP